MANSTLPLILSLLIACLLTRQASLLPLPHPTSTPQAPTAAATAASEMESPNASENGTSGSTLDADGANDTSLGIDQQMNLTDPCLTVCDSDYRVEFSCTVSLNASQTTTARGSLLAGMETLWDYGRALYSQYDFTICLEPATHYTQEEFSTTSVQSHQFVANWVGVFEAYAEHTLEILSGDTVVLTEQERKQLITLYKLISGLLSDYRALLEPHYCTCLAQNGGDGECFGVPSIPVKDLEQCVNKVANVGYHIWRIMGGAVRNMRSWLKVNGGLSSPPPSSEDWVTQHITSCYTPIL